KGIWWSPRIIGRGFRLKERKFHLLPTQHPSWAQIPSRSLPLFARAERFPLRGALSASASLLPPVACGRAPQRRRLPRMADFAEWGFAVAPAIGWSAEDFGRAYWANRNEAFEAVTEDDPVAPHILRLLQR